MMELTVLNPGQCTEASSFPVSLCGADQAWVFESCFASDKSTFSPLPTSMSPSKPLFSTHPHSLWTKLTK